MTATPYVTFSWSILLEEFINFRERGPQSDSKSFKIVQVGYVKVVTAFTINL